jgi:hypothetical protein
VRGLRPSGTTVERNACDLRTPYSTIAAFVRLTLRLLLYGGDRRAQ